MPENIDARGLACPQPVVLAKKALERGSDVEIQVDNRTAVENLKRLGGREGCDVDVEEKGENLFVLRLKIKEGAGGKAEAVSGEAASGPFVIVISENGMGRGDEGLGHVLIRSFIHTVTEMDRLPDTMIFYNTGVKLTTSDSEVIDDLKALEEAGVEILVCGTCTNYFDITESVGAGVISNMYDIAGTMSRAGRLVCP